MSRALDESVSDLSWPPINADWGRKYTFQPKNNPLPFDFGFLEVNEKTESPAGGSEIVQTLRGVPARKTLDTFQLNDQHVFDGDVSKVFANAPALVVNTEGSLSRSPDTANAELPEQSALVDLLQESGTQGV